MGGTRPLTIDDLVEVGGIGNIGLLQISSVLDAAGHLVLDRPTGRLAARATRSERHPKSANMLRQRRLPEKSFAFKY